MSLLLARLGGGATVIDLTAAAFAFSPQATQNRLTAALTAALFTLVPQMIQNIANAKLSAAVFSFSALAIDFILTPMGSAQDWLIRARRRNRRSK